MTPPRRADATFLRRHPAHWLALGFGSGLAPWAPGTVGTAWAWLSFVAAERVLGPGLAWGWMLLAGGALGLWACTRTAQHLGTGDPGSIVWDEILAFWAVLWVIQPAGFGAQLLAFALFRYFDAAKPGPVSWADAWGKVRADGRIGWRQGAGILWDDLVAAGCTLMVLALLRVLGVF